MVSKEFIILPLTGALIGFITNYIAIKLLFYPQKPIAGIQGLIPKRKEKLAESIAEASLHFLPNSIDNLTKIPLIGNKILEYIKKEISHKVRKTEDKKIQDIIEKVARRELLFIEISGAILGFIIGIIQALILFLL